MVLAVSWDEYNGTPAYASPSVEGLTHTHWGSADVAELDPNEHRIASGENSFNKQQAVRFSGFAGETVSNFSLYCEDLGGAGVIVARRTGADTGDRLYYKDSGGKTTASPAATAISGGSLMPAEKPGTPNIGGGSVTSDGDGSNVFLTQIQSGSAVLRSEGLLLTFEFEVS